MPRILRTSDPFSPSRPTSSPHAKVLATRRILTTMKKRLFASHPPKNALKNSPIFKAKKKFEKLKFFRQISSAITHYHLTSTSSCTKKPPDEQDGMNVFNFRSYSQFISMCR